MEKFYLITERIIDAGEEDVYDVPIGTKVVYYCHAADKDEVDEYSAYGACGKGLTPTEAIEDIKRMERKRIATKGNNEIPSCEK